MMFSMSLSSTSIPKSPQRGSSPMAYFAPGSRASVAWQKPQPRKFAAKLGIDFK